MPDNASESQVRESSQKGEDANARTRRIGLRVKHDLRQRLPRVVLVLMVVVLGQALRKWLEPNLGPNLHGLADQVALTLGPLAFMFIVYQVLRLYATACNFAQSPKAHEWWTRGAWTLAAIFVGLRAGTSYAHLCLAGSRLIENTACLGTPLVAGLLVFSLKRRSVGIVLAAGVIAVVWLLHRPYLDWAHGN